MKKEKCLELLDGVIEKMQKASDELNKAIKESAANNPCVAHCLTCAYESISHSTANIAEMKTKVEAFDPKEKEITKLFNLGIPHGMEHIADDVQFFFDLDDVKEEK